MFTLQRSPQRSVQFYSLLSPDAGNLPVFNRYRSLRRKNPPLIPSRALSTAGNHFVHGFALV